MQTSLVVQWLRIHLPVEGTQVRSLVQEDPTSWGPTKPMHHNYWSMCAQSLCPATGEATTVRSPHTPQRPATPPVCSSKDPAQPTVNKNCEEGKCAGQTEVTATTVRLHWVMADRYKERRGLERLQLELTLLIFTRKSGRTSPIHKPTDREGGGWSNNSFTHSGHLGIVGWGHLGDWQQETRGALVCIDVFNMSAVVLAVPTALSKGNFYIHNSCSWSGSPRQLCFYHKILLYPYTLVKT